MLELNDIRQQLDLAMLTDIVQLLQASTPWYFTLTLIFGLCVGSFLNVVIYRLPLMLDREWQTQLQTAQGLAPTTTHPHFNLILPNSHCPNCKTPIPFWANIPVLSYLFLAGKSVCCQQKIAKRYPLIELLSALLTLNCAVHFGVTWQALAAMALCWGLVTLIFIDLDHFLLPDNITQPLLWLGLYLSLFSLFATSQQSIIGAIAGYGTFWTVGWLFKTLRGIEGMGQGDYKLLALLGAWLGWQLLPLIILLSSVAGTAYSLYQMLFHEHQPDTPIPFGPFLAFAGLVALFWGSQINDTYLFWLTGVY